MQLPDGICIDLQTKKHVFETFQDFHLQFSICRGCTRSEFRDFHTRERYDGKHTYSMNQRQPKQAVTSFYFSRCLAAKV